MGGHQRKKPSSKPEIDFYSGQPLPPTDELYFDDEFPGQGEKKSVVQKKQAADADFKAKNPAPGHEEHSSRPLSRATVRQIKKQMRQIKN